MKIHPLTVLLICFLFLSLTFNYANGVANRRLRAEIEYLKHRTIIILPPEKQKVDKRFELKT